MTVSLRHFAAIAVATAQRFACRPVPCTGMSPGQARQTGVKAALLVMASCLSIGAHAALVDFTGQPTGNNPNPLELSGATFTTVGGFNVVTTSSKKALCPSVRDYDAAVCSLSLELDFAGAASNISFEFGANNDHVVGDDIGDVEIYSGTDLLGLLDMVVADDTSATFDLVSLAGYGNVTRLVISSTDFGGLIYDNFRFDLATAVPEPATWTLVLAALGLSVRSARRREGRQPQAGAGDH